MSPADFFEPKLGFSLLYPGQNPLYDGQCVQSVMLWIKANGVEPPVYASAYLYYQNGVPGYTKISVGAPILEGDIMVWGSNYSPSSGNGHIDVASQDGTPKDFWAYDSNFDKPLKLSKVHHNGSDNNYIVGYLRKEIVMIDIPDDSDIINAKRASTGAKNYQPTGPEFDYYKQIGANGKPIHGWHDLLYDTIAGMQVQIDVASAAVEFTPYNGAELFIKK